MINCGILATQQHQKTKIIINLNIHFYIKKDHSYVQITVTNQHSEKQVDYASDIQIKQLF